MTPKYIFAALGILLAILSFVFAASAAVPMLAGGVIAVGVSVIIP